MKLKTLLPFLLITFFTMTSLQAESKYPEKVTKEMAHLLETIVTKDYQSFISSGTQQFKLAISKTMFKSVCDQMSDNLSQGYSYVYFGSLSRSGILEHVYKIKYAGFDDDTLARITIIDGKVAGFLLQ